MSVFELKWCGIIGGWVGDLGHGLVGWCGVMYACVVSLDSLYR